MFSLKAVLFNNIPLESGKNEHVNSSTISITSPISSRIFEEKKNITKSNYASDRKQMF